MQRGLQSLFVRASARAKTQKKKEKKKKELLRNSSSLTSTFPVISTRAPVHYRYVVSIASTYIQTEEGCLPRT
jgi:hypothetical protein